MEDLCQTHQDMTPTEYSTQRLDHLGIVAGLCHEINLIEQVNACVGPDQRKVSVGEAVQAMVLNGLGFTTRALYLTPEFFRNKPLDVLIGDGIEADDLNDDSLGRALDRLYEVAVLTFYAKFLIPPVTFLDIGIREGASVFFAELLGVPDAAALSASVSLACAQAIRSVKPWLTRSKPCVTVSAISSSVTAGSVGWASCCIIPALCQR